MDVFRSEIHPLFLQSTDLKKKERCRLSATLMPIALTTSCDAHVVMKKYREEIGDVIGSFPIVISWLFTNSERLRQGTVCQYDSTSWNVSFAVFGAVLDLKVGSNKRSFYSALV